MYADVKLEPYEMLESVPESVKLVGGVKDVVLRGSDSVTWWEEFPKRWVIVVLCFWAFLLCNMDRVCCSFLAYLITLLHYNLLTMK